MNLGKYGKFWLAVIAAIISFTTLITGPESPLDHISAHEWYTLLAGGVTAFVTLLVPNWTWKYAKTAGALVAGVGTWVLLVIDSAPVEITSSEWNQLAIVGLTALGVYAISNAPASTVGLVDPRTEYGGADPIVVGLVAAVGVSVIMGVAFLA